VIVCISNLHHLLGRFVTMIGLFSLPSILIITYFYFCLPKLTLVYHTFIFYFWEFTLIYLISRDSQILRDFQRDSWQLSRSRLITRATFSSRDSALVTLSESSRDSPLARLPAASMCVADPLAIYVTVSPSLLARFCSRESLLARLPAASMRIADPLAIYVTVSSSPLMFSSITQQWLQSRRAFPSLFTQLTISIIIHLFVLNMRYLHYTWCPESSPQHFCGSDSEVDMDCITRPVSSIYPNICIISN
jgi:hypothetical protein